MTGRGRVFTSAQGVRSRSDISLFCSIKGKAVPIAFLLLCRIGAAFAGFRGDSLLGSGFIFFVSAVLAINSGGGLATEELLTSLSWV